MSQDEAIARAIAVWRLRAAEPFPFARFYAPETFITGLRPVGPRLSVSDAELGELEKIGTREGPYEEDAIDLLRRVRRTIFEGEAAALVLRAPGPVSIPVRLEAAYLFAASGDPRGALRVLEPHEWPTPEPAAPPDPGIRGLASAAADAIAREAGFMAKQRARRRTSPAVTPVPLRREPPALAVEVPDLDVERLVTFGDPQGPTQEDALALLRATRGTGQGRQAVRNLLEARRHAPLPEPVRALCAELLAEYGDHEGAFELMKTEPPSPPPLPEPGIDVDAPLDEGRASERAADAERVLAKDAARLGVRERHTRFRAVARAAALTMDAFRALGGRGKREELRGAARDLEDAGEPRRAAEVYALGGHHGEATRVGVPERPAPPAEEEAHAALAAVRALDERGLRLAAIEAARAFLDEHADAELAAFARGVVARLVRGPVVSLAIDGIEHRVALGEVVTIGRTGATLNVASQLVSRTHLELRRHGGVPVVEDPGSHNGTWLAGARLTAPLPIGDGLDFGLGREIPCNVHASPLGVAIEVAGERTLAPLGPLVVHGVRLALVPRDDGAVVSLEVEPGVRATLGDALVETTIELALRDVVHVAGSVPHAIRVLRGA